MKNKVENILNAKAVLPKFEDMVKIIEQYQGILDCVNTTKQLIQRRPSSTNNPNYMELKKKQLYSNWQKAVEISK